MLGGTGVDFRIAEHSDAHSIAELHAESWRRTYRGMMSDEFLDRSAASNRLAVWRERLSEDKLDRRVCLALDGAHLSGFVCAFANEDSVWGSYIDNLHVAAEYHRLGVGTELMLRAAEWLGRMYPQLGVYLWVMEANNRARRFYERLGAKNCGTSDKRDPGGGSAPNCRYVWTTPAALRKG
jgi:ribosomal protein S18 acetylase RimI-like enzyme